MTRAITVTAGRRKFVDLVLLASLPRNSRQNSPLVVEIFTVDYIIFVKNGDSSVPPRVCDLKLVSVDPFVTTESARFQRFNTKWYVQSQTVSNHS